MILGDDPKMAGLAAGASVLGKLSGPQQAPVGFGSIIGQLGGAMYGAQQDAARQHERIANDRMLRQAQEEELKAQIAERQRVVQSQAKFNSILGSSPDPTDPVTILGAGIQSGAFGPKETSTFMAQVMERRAARDQKMEELRVRSEDQKLAREERERFAREMVELQGKQREEMVRLTATLRPAQERLVPVEGEDGNVTYVPQSQASGLKVPPPRRDARGLPPNAIKDLGEKGELATNFIRLTGTFKDDFGGKKTGVLGDAQNIVGRNIGAGYEDQANWWQDYQMEKNKIRNKLFGSALTATEASEFEKATINPGMKPDIIRKNLARQKQMAVRAAKKLSGAYQKGGYNEAQIFEALGISPDELAAADEKDPWE